MALTGALTVQVAADELSPCSPNPCSFDGKCTPHDGSSFECQCPFPYHGTMCRDWKNTTGTPSMKIVQAYSEIMERAKVAHTCVGAPADKQGKIDNAFGTLFSTLVATVKSPVNVAITKQKTIEEALVKARTIRDYELQIATATQDILKKSIQQQINNAIAFENTTSQRIKKYFTSVIVDGAKQKKKDDAVCTNYYDETTSLLNTKSSTVLEIQTLVRKLATCGNTEIGNSNGGMAHSNSSPLDASAVGTAPNEFDTTSKFMAASSPDTEKTNLTNLLQVESTRSAQNVTQKRCALLKQQLSKQMEAFTPSPVTQQKHGLMDPVQAASQHVKSLNLEIAQQHQAANAAKVKCMSAATSNLNQVHATAKQNRKMELDRAQGTREKAIAAAGKEDHEGHTAFQQELTRVRALHLPELVRVQKELDDKITRTLNLQFNLDYVKSLANPKWLRSVHGVPSFSLDFFYKKIKRLHIMCSPKLATCAKKYHQIVAHAHSVEQASTKKEHIGRIKLSKARTHKALELVNVGAEKQLLNATVANQKTNAIAFNKSSFEHIETAFATVVATGEKEKNRGDANCVKHFKETTDMLNSESETVTHIAGLVARLKRCSQSSAASLLQTNSDTRFKHRVQSRENCDLLRQQLSNSKLSSKFPKEIGTTSKFIAAASPDTENQQLTSLLQVGNENVSPLPAVEAAGQNVKTWNKQIAQQHTDAKSVKSRCLKASSDFMKAVLANAKDTRKTEMANAENTTKTALLAAEKELHDGTVAFQQRVATVQLAVLAAKKRVHTNAAIIREAKSNVALVQSSIDNGFTPSFGHNITGPALFQQLEKIRNKCLPVLFDCLDGQCEIDCTVGEWSKCTAACGGGTQSRLVEAEVFGGKKCKSYNTKQVCNTAACPIDCQLTDWSNCSEPCGKGAATTLAPQSNGNTPYPQSNGDTPATQINGNTLVPQSTLQQELDALRTTTDEDHARIATLEEELAADGATPATRTNGNTPPPQTKQSAKAAEQKQWVHKTAASKPSSTDESSAVGEERGSTNSENNNQAEKPNKGATSDSSLTKGILIGISVALVGGVMVALCVLYVKKSKEHARRRLMMGVGGENDLNKQSIPNLDSSDVSDPGWTDQELESDVESQLAIQEQGK